LSVLIRTGVINPARRCIVEVVDLTEFVEVVVLE